MAKPRAHSQQEYWLKRARLRLGSTLKKAQRLKKITALGPCSRNWRAEIQLASTAQMKRVNGKFLKKNFATDVLSFPSGEPFYSLGHLGSVLICLPVLKRQARERKITPEMELQILVAHAVLHLLGLDHEKSAKHAKKMAEFEEDLLHEIVPASWIRKSEGRCLVGLTGRVLLRR